MEFHGRGQNPQFSHILSLDFGAGPGVLCGDGSGSDPCEDDADDGTSAPRLPSKEIDCVTACDLGLFLGLANGRVALHSWKSGHQECRSAATNTPIYDLHSCHLLWKLPEAAGSASTLVAMMCGTSTSFRDTNLPAAGGDRSGVLTTTEPRVVVGTQSGWLVHVGPRKDDVCTLGVPHEGSLVSALLLGPQIEILEMHPEKAGGSSATPHDSVAQVAETECENRDTPSISATVATRQTLFSADSAGRVFRSLLSNCPDADGVAKPTVTQLCAELQSPVLALELCERSGRLLISTAERIAVVDDVLDAATPGDAKALDCSSRVRLVGSKPHKGQLTATFSKFHGPESLVAARPGGRLWVAEAASGTVQTTLKFQGGAGGEDKKASLGRLVVLQVGKVVSWHRAESHVVGSDNVAGSVSGVVGVGPSSAGSGHGDATMTMLDLEAIAVCKEWSPAPVLDVARFGDADLFLAHRHSVSALSLFDSPTALLTTLVAYGTLRLGSGGSVAASACEVLRQIVGHRDALTAAMPAGGLLALMRPLIVAVAELGDCNLTTDEGIVNGRDHVADFKRWISELEETEADELRLSGDPSFSLAAAPLANFPTAEIRQKVSTHRRRTWAGPEATANLANFSNAESRQQVFSPTVVKTRRHVREMLDIDSVGSTSKESTTRRGKWHLTPQLLKQCRRAMRSAAADAQVVPASVPENRRGVTLSIALPDGPTPEPCGVTLRSLGVLPFRSSPQALQFLRDAVTWLADFVDALGANAWNAVAVVGPTAWEEVIRLASTVFELICLYAEPRAAVAHSATQLVNDSSVVTGARALGDGASGNVAGSRASSASSSTTSTAAIVESAWPRLGMPSVKSGVSPSDVVAIAPERLTTHFREISKAAERGRNSDGNDGLGGEPWVTCTDSWSPEVAISFCNVFFVGSSSLACRSALERCFVRINGIAARGGCWPAAVKLIHARIGTFSVTSKGIAKAVDRPPWSSGHRSTARCMFTECNQELSASSPTCSTSHASSGRGRNTGVASIHSSLAQALLNVAVAGGNNGDAHVLDLRRIFNLALAQFPQVLPWNVDVWISSALEDSTCVPTSGEGVMQKSLGALTTPAACRRWRGMVSELMAGEFLQYLTKLLPTCAKFADASRLVDAAIAVALHGYRHGCNVVELHCARNAVVDHLVEGQHRSLVAPQRLQEQRYPLGALRMFLLSKEPDTGCDSVARKSDVSDDDFTEAVATVLGILADRCGAPHAEAKPETMRSNVSASIPKDHLFDRGENSAGSATVPCTSRGESELARALLQLCGESPKRWSHLLEAVSNDLSIEHERSPVSSRSRACATTSPIERMLVALVAARPGPEAAAACLRAATAGALVESTAASASESLWASALIGCDNRPGDESSIGDDANAVGGNNVGNGSWLTLPDPLPAPPVPKPPLRLAGHQLGKELAPFIGSIRPSTITPWKRTDEPHTRSATFPVATTTGAVETVDVSEEVQEQAGFYRSDGHYVYVSEDGLYARHRDDSGEDMHGVIVGAEPLDVGRAGLYFEVELEEVRVEEMPDGLTIGVSATSASAAAKAEPATAEHLPHTWTVGYDGQMWDAATASLRFVDWDPRCLQQGDTVGVLVTKSEGELLVFHNGVPICPGPRGIPVGLCPLYAVVDLLGSARAVRWRPGAVPPIGGS